MILYRHLIATSFALFFAACSFAQTTVLPAKYATSIDSNAVFITANYGGICNYLPIQAQLYLVTNGVVNYQTDCYINPAWNTSNGSKLLDTNLGMCFFKQPRTNNPANSILLRLWSATSDCSKYAWQTGILTTPAGYTDYFINTNVNPNRYYGLANGSMVTIDQPNYQVKIDKRSGATFEFYNKRATFTENGQTLPFMSNAIYADVGAALQVAIHDTIDNKQLGQKEPFAETSCGGLPKANHTSDEDGQGYWNPTQAGSYCVTDGTYQGKGVQPNCDNGVCNTTVTNVATPSGTDKVLVTNEFNMLNFDYDIASNAPYHGPVTNPPKTISDAPTLLDNLRFSQIATAHPNYIEYDITFQELGAQGGVRNNTTLEIPTFYFNPNFRKYTIKRASGYFTQTIPDRIKYTPLINKTELGMSTAPWDIANSRDEPYNHEKINWITFENIKGPTNDVYTIAWFLKTNLKDAIAATGMVYGGYSWGLTEGSIERTIKFVNLANVRLVSREKYQAKYVVFPFRYWETPPGSSETVEQIIARIASTY